MQVSIFVFRARLANWDILRGTDVVQTTVLFGCLSELVRGSVVLGFIYHTLFS